MSSRSKGSPAPPQVIRNRGGQILISDTTPGAFGRGASVLLDLDADTARPN